MSMKDLPSNWIDVDFPQELRDILNAAPQVLIPETREDLLNWALGRERGETDWSPGHREDSGTFNVGFEVPGRGRVEEAVVAKTGTREGCRYTEHFRWHSDP